MKNVICQLEELKTKYSELENKNSELAGLVAYYEEYFRLNQYRKFNRSDEKLILIRVRYFLSLTRLKMKPVTCSRK